MRIDRPDDYDDDNIPEIDLPGKNMPDVLPGQGIVPEILPGNFPRPDMPDGTSMYLSGR